MASNFILDGDETHILNTIIDGSQPSNPDSGSCVYFISGEDTTSVLCGFTLTGGTGTLSLDFGDVSGGGVYTLGCGGTIKNNIIEYNSVSNVSSYANGGGIVADLNGLGLIIENNIIRNNTVTGNEWSTGGGIGVFDWSYTSYARVANNIIINNTVTDPNTATGGGIEINGGSNDFFFIGNYINGNTCNGVGWGGGIDFFDCSPTAKNNLIVGNSAPLGGGIVLDNVDTTSSKSELNYSRRLSHRYNRVNANQLKSLKILLASSFENNTIINNSANDEGGGITVWGTMPQLMNFVVWGNIAPVDSQISGTPDVQYSDVEGGYAGTGNINLNPQLIPGSDIYLLAGTSPCIDAGNPDPQYNDVEDPTVQGNPLGPAQGTLRNDIGHLGGSNSQWGYSKWPTPVELISFSAVANGKEILLSWSTATELNNYGFEIQRKALGSEFATVAFVKGQGTTTNINEYNFTDNNLDEGKYFYRLKQMDFDGLYSYSRVVEVEVRTLDKFTLEQNYPNPFNPTTTIGYVLQEKSNAKLTLLNAFGEEIAVLVNEEQDKGYHKVEFNGSKLVKRSLFLSAQGW